MPRKSIYNEGYPHVNLRRLPQRAFFARRGCLREFEGAEARCQSNRGIKSERMSSSLFTSLLDMCIVFFKRKSLHIKNLENYIKKDMKKGPTIQPVTLFSLQS